MNWLHYLAEANLYLGVFYLAYCLFLNKETYYTFNRVYLLVSCLLAFALPLVQLDFLKPTIYITTGSTEAATIAADNFTWQDGLLYSYLTGVIIFAIQFAVKLYQLQKMARLKPAYITGDYKLVYLEGSTTAFSFFNYLFIGTDAPQPELITRHELVHIRQKHSADVVLIELLKIINWFNPAVYLLQNSIKAVHEYIADERTALIENDPTTYSTFLVNNAYGISGPSFTHSFFNYNLLKKRIIMLHQKRSGSLARLKYLIAVPLCAGLLCESTLGFSKTYGFVNIGSTAVVVVTDTVPKKLPPPPKPVPPKPVITMNHKPGAVKFPPPVVRKDKSTKHAKVEPVTIYDPNAPIPDVSKVKFPPPVVRKDKSTKHAKVEPVTIYDPNAPIPDVSKVKFPPPVVRKDKSTKHAKVEPVTIYDPNAPIPDVSKVKFPPPVVRKDKPSGPVKFPPPIKGKVEKTTYIPAKGNKPAVIVTDVRLDEPVKPSKKS